MSFIEELKRRNVFRVGIAYVLLGWVVLQAADFALDLIDAPNWVIQVFFIAGLIGLPFALFFAWAFELTPEGIKREEDVDRTSSVTPTTGRKLDKAIIAFLAAAVVLLLADRFFIADRGQPALGPEVSRQAPESATPSDAAPMAKSVAVLPFADMSQGGDQAWFADGLAEEILNALVRVPDLQVSARTSSFQYRDTELSIPEIAVELGVAHVLEGSVRSAGDQVRVTAQLIRAEDGFHVWSENYDREAADMIAIQEDLATKIALALETSMDPEALARMSEVGTNSIAAYQEYLKGLQDRQDSTAAGDIAQRTLTSYEHFENAREIDPSFSKAHVEAARFWKVQMTTNRIDTGATDLEPRSILANYHERIDRASRSAGTELDRILILADQAGVDLRLREALSLYQQYLDGRPNDIAARFEAIFVALMLSETEVARSLLGPMIERARSEFNAANGVVNLAYRVMPPSEAADIGLSLLERWPNSPQLLYQVHRTLLWAGRNFEARSVADRLRARVPNISPLLTVREACAEGDRPAAQRMLDEFQGGSGNDTSTRWLMASMLGDPESAYETLAPLEAVGIPYLLSSFLIYSQFDPAPYPTLMAVLDRENVRRPPAEQEPFACPPPKKTSVAVLAFDNMSPDPENEYFADGISEEILNVLSGLDDLRVIARTSAFSFKNSGATVAEIAERLDVGYVVEGSVRKAGNRVRVSAQLIDTETEAQLWSDTYDRDLDNIFAVQDEIARAIAGELELTLTPDQQTQLVAATTDNVEAYNQYLLGRQLWHSRNIHNLRASTEALNEAVMLDPEFAEAWAALADALVLIPEYAVDFSAVDSIAAARDAVNRALELKPDLPQALVTRGYIRAMHDFDWENAEKDFLRALALDPEYPTAYQWYGEFISVRYLDIDRALAQFQKASELDPLAPIMWHVSGWTTVSVGRLEESIGYFKRALELNPNMQHTYGNLSLAYALLGQYDSAREARTGVFDVLGTAAPEELTLIDALEDPSRRGSYLEALEDSELVPDGALGKAMNYAILGDYERALDNLESSLEQGDPYAAHASRVGFYDPMREDPRFQAHLAKMNLWPPEERP
ncbi:MAG: hypothetical protein V2I57_02965 [Xanthomonadales bacterium]|jgi:TolB-like protein/Tfp pilus assembly protein PilF|nr:hypothetical protein [Xanthomonadales bacterium]